MGIQPTHVSYGSIIGIFGCTSGITYAPENTMYGHIVCPEKAEKGVADPEHTNSVGIVNDWPDKTISDDLKKFAIDLEARDKNLNTQIRSQTAETQLRFLLPNLGSMYYDAKKEFVCFQEFSNKNTKYMYFSTFRFNVKNAVSIFLRKLQQMLTPHAENTKRGFVTPFREKAHVPVV